MPSDDRTRRLALRRDAKDVVERLRTLVRDLSEVARLEDVSDPVGVVRIKCDEQEADYGTALLDMIALAQKDAGGTRVVEVYVITSPADSIHRARPRGGKSDDKKQRRIQRRRAREGA